MSTFSKDRDIRPCQETKEGVVEGIKRRASSLKDFYWQEGYGAFSVSPSHVEAFQNYIAEQVEHHRKEDFKEEFRRLLKKYGVEYDEKYVWE